MICSDACRPLAQKNAVAVSHCKRGKGLIKVNGIPLELVQPEILRFKVFEPILLLGRARFAGVDMRVRVKGGGHVSQVYGASPQQRSLKPLGHRHATACCWGSRRDCPCPRPHALLTPARACLIFQLSGKRLPSHWLRSTRSLWTKRRRRRSRTSCSPTTAPSSSLTPAAASPRSSAAVQRAPSTRSHVRRCFFVFLSFASTLTRVSSRNADR